MKGNDFEMNRKIKQILSLLLAAVIFVGVMPMSTVPASAATNGHSQSEAMAWLNSKIGIQIGNGQCPALAREYYSYLGYSVSGNGKDYENNVPNGWTRTYYYSGYVPQPGDIAVWRATNTDAGKIYGHVAIVQSATSSSMTCYEQGESANYKVRTHGYSYGMVTCFIRPDFEQGTSTLPGIVKDLHCDKKVYNTNESITFTWSAVPTATEYWVYLWKDGVQLFQFNCGTNTSFTQAPSSEGSYTLIIRPGNASGFNDSSPRCNFVVTNKIPDVVTDLRCDKEVYSTNESITFTWSAVPTATEYWVYLWKDGVQLFQFNCGTNTSFTQAPSSEGSYTLIIRPGNVNGYNSSSTPCSFKVKNNEPIKTYTVSYNINGGTGSIENQTKIHGENLTLSSAKPTGKSFTVNYNANGGNVSASGKTVSQTFTSWNTAKNGSGKTYLPGEIYSDNANLTLYAQYSNPSVGTLPTPTRSGYTFDGWYTAKDGGTKVSEPLKVTANITLYAHWTKIEQHIPTVKSVKIDDNAEINYKSSYKISSEITAESGAEYTAEWQSSNPKVASVDKNGNVTALKKGTAKITCTVTDSYGNTVSDTCNVTVKYSFGQWLIIILLFGWIWYI